MWRHRQPRIARPMAPSEAGRTESFSKLEVSSAIVKFDSFRIPSFALRCSSAPECCLSEPLHGIGHPIQPCSGRRSRFVSAATGRVGRCSAGTSGESQHQLPVQARTGTASRLIALGDTTSSGPLLRRLPVGKSLQAKCLVLSCRARRLSILI